MCVGNSLHHFFFLNSYSFMLNLFKCKAEICIYTYFDSISVSPIFVNTAFVCLSM